MGGAFARGVVLILCSRFTFVLSAVETNEHRLLKDLFLNYNSNVRPVLNNRDPVKATIDVGLTQIVDFNFRNQQLTVNLWMRMGWKDEHMRWNISDYGNVSRVYVDPKLIWRPDITLYNDVSTRKTNTMFDYMVKVGHDGTMTWLSPVTPTTSCDLDVTYFPWDDQNCSLQYSSWMFDAGSLDLDKVREKFDLRYYSEHGEWEIKDALVRKQEDWYSCCPFPYNSIFFELQLKRRPMYYLVNLILPCIFITVTALLSFCLPPDSGEKISLSVTVLLATTVFLLVVNESMPIQSVVVPYIAKYFMGMMSILSLSLGITVFVLSIHHKGAQGYPLPGWVRSVFLGPVAKVMCLRGVMKKTMKSAPNKKDEGEKNENETPVTAWGDKWDEADMGKKTNKVSSFDQNRNGSENVSSLIPWLRNISCDMEIITESVKQKNEEAELESEWICLAIVLDRLFFITFLILLLIICLAFLLHRP